VAAGILDDLERHGDAAEHRRAARASDLTWAFPNGLDALDALERSLEIEPDDAVALLLVGELLYSHGRRRDARDQWEKAIALGLENAVLYRNAAVAAYNIAHDDDQAWSRYEQAIEIAPGDARLRFEQDQLAIRLEHAAADRLARLRPVEALVLSRDDLTIEYVKLLVAAGDADAGYRILMSRPFHPWEGGEGQAIAAWDAVIDALGLPLTDPPPTLGESRAQYVPPVARHDDGVTDYFATSLPELLLFSREHDG
jgi:tetratricopeptide (TPR) repeat protein